MSDVDKQLLSLIDLMSQIDHIQGERLLFDQINNFFYKDLGHEEIIVFSGAKIKKPTDPSNNFFRVLFNKNYFNKKYPAEEIENYLNIFQNQDKKNWDIIDIKKDKFLFLAMGENSKQFITGVLKLNSSISETLLESFSKMINSLNRSNEQLKQYKKMEELVYTDDVTGLFNQRKLNKDIENALIKHRQIKDKFSILFIDIDHFKSVNDGHGHLVGTKILFDLASLLNCVVRESDFIYRYGGDEFVVLIPNTGPDVAKKIGDRVLDTVKSHKFEVKKPGSTEMREFKLTVSIGVASFPQNAKTREDILEIADQMMYEAKKTGRGRVCFTHDLFETTVQGELTTEKQKTNV